MQRSRAINTFGLGDDGGGPGRRADHQVPRRRLDRDLGDGRPLRHHARHPAALRPRRRGAARRRRGRLAAVAGPRDRARLEGAQADAACGRLCPGRPPQHARGGHRRRRRRGHRAADAAVGRGRHPGPAAGAELAVPRDHPADHRVRARHPAAQPARRRHGLHPRVRRRPLVGADPAQPERAAAQGPAAVHARRDGDVGAVPAAARRRRPRSGPSARRYRARSASGRAERRPDARDRRRGPTTWSGPVLELEVGPSRTAATAWRGTRAGWSSSGTRSRASGSGPSSPRAAPARGSCGRTPSRSLQAVADRVESRCAGRRAGRLRWLRLPARGAGRASVELLGEVVAEQLHRLAGIEREVEVEAGGRATTTGSAGGRECGSRRRRTAARACASTGRTRSSASTAARSRCLTSRTSPTALRRRRRVGRGGASARPGERRRRDRPARRARRSPRCAAGRRWQVGAGDFWQVHPGAADALVDAVLDGRRRRRPGELAWDLYAGVGLFSAAPRRRPSARRGKVVSVESHRRASGNAASQPRRPAAGPVRRRIGSTGSSAAGVRRAASTSSCSTRREPAPAPGVVRDRRAQPTSHRATSPATRPRWPATWRTFDCRGYRAERAAGVRHLPDDPPCRVCCHLHSPDVKSRAGLPLGFRPWRGGSSCISGR